MKIVTGTYKSSVGDYDGLHAFESRVSDGFGGKMNSTVNDALKEFYNTKKKNPFISSIKVIMDDNKFIVNWEVTIEESPNGKAYIGLTSMGSSGKTHGNDGSINRASEKINSKKRDLIEISKKTEIVDILDFNFKSKTKGFGIRQIFIIYTDPDAYPYLPIK